MRWKQLGMFFGPMFCKLTCKWKRSGFPELFDFERPEIPYPGGGGERTRYLAYSGV